MSPHSSYRQGGCVAFIVEIRVPASLQQALALQLPKPMYVSCSYTHAIDVDPEQCGILNFCRRTSYEQRMEGDTSFMMGNLAACI